MDDVYMGLVVPLAITVPIVVGAAKYRTLDRPMKFGFLFLLVGGVTNVIAELLAVYELPNLPVLHVYTIVELSILLLFYRSIIDDSKLAARIPAFIAGFILLSIVNSLFFQSVFTYNSYARAAEAILIMFFAIAWFFRRLDRMDKPAANPAQAIINAALLLYFSGAFILFIISNVVVKDRVLGTAIWNVHATLVLLMYMLFAVALWKHKP